MSLGIVFLVIFYVLAPWLILFLCHRFRWVNKIGSVVIAYAVGLLLGNLGILPQGTEEVQNMLTTLTIPLAIPLLLFSSNIKTWARIAGKTFLSMILAIISVIIVVIIGFFWFKGGGMNELWKISGMLIGVYSGGTPNLASLKMMLDVNAETYIITHTYDMVLSSLYLAFLLIIGHRFFLLFLKPFPLKKDKNEDWDFDGRDPYFGMLKKETLYPLLKASGLSALIFAFAGGISLILPEDMQMVVVILVITTLGILFSLIPAVNKIKKSFEAGMYLILIFSIVVASMADVENFAGLTPHLFQYITFAVFGSLILHLILSKIFNVDADTLMITSTALICSPPFVPMIAGSLKNREIVISGLTVGIIGYAVGNYLGFGVAELLKGFM